MASIVQVKPDGFVNGAGSVSFNSNVGAGRSVLVVVDDQGAGLTGQSDNQGGDYSSPLWSQLHGTGTIWAFLVTTASAGAWTFSASGMSFARIFLIEFDATLTVDSLVHASGAFSVPTGSAATATASGIGIGVVKANPFSYTSPQTPVTGGGWNTTVSDTDAVLIGDQTTSNGNNYTFGSNEYGGNDWHVWTLLLKSAAAVPAVTSVTPSSFAHGRAGIAVAGTAFGAAQGAGAVIISPTNNVADAAAVTQTVTAWGDTSITFTAVQNGLPQGACYLFVKDNSGASNASGAAVSFTSVRYFLT